MEIARNKIVFALISFIVGMLIMFFAASYIQHHLGMLGLVITELMILAIALISVAASRLSFKQVFRIKASSFREWVSSLCIYLSAFFGSMTVSFVLTTFFPSVTETGNALNSFILSGGFVFGLIAVSILPGICEEAWHRGYLLTSLGSIKSVATRVAIMGLVFGIFHLDPARFLQTMILGMSLSFMRIKTDNFLIPVVFHSLNNLFSLTLVFLFASLPQEIVDSTDQNAAMAPEVLILWLIFTTALSIMFLSLGLYNFKKVRGKTTVPTALYPSGWLPPTTLPVSPTFAQYTAPQQWSPPTMPPMNPLTMPPVMPPLWQNQFQHQLPDEPQMTSRAKTIITVSICGGVALLSCIGCLLLSMFM